AAPASPIPGVFLRLHAASWKELVGIFDALHAPHDRWIFRGQGDARWSLASSLERAFLRSRHVRGVRVYAEDSVIQQFRRRAHHFYQHPPALDEHFEWWALLRHHGAPARLLDVTDSPYIAAYFAFENAADEGKCAVWAIETHVMSEKVREAHL